jgi:uncharacterized RDD family membrane protein YckC
MVYEAILLFGVAFAAGYAVLASMQWSYPLSPAQRAVVQAVLFVAIGLYFVVCWTRGGQTLALKAWHLRVVDASGRPPRVARAFWRYVLAWHLWLPGIAIAALLRLQVPQALAVITASFAALLVPALFDRDRRLLHDRWTGTRVIRVPA